MSPIIVSALFGFVKGYFSEGPHREVDRDHEIAANLVAPVREEMIYRAIPLYTFGDAFPKGGTAVAFAIDHVMGEGPRLGYRTGPMAARFADVFFGGLLYEYAFRRWGIFGAVAAHSFHNVMCGVGYRARRRAPVCP